jgi:segregation and condensation protein A
MASREIRRDNFTVAGCMARISRMVRRGNCTFSQLFGEAYSRQEVVTMFMALLELIKLNRLHVSQESAYEDIVLSA